MQLHELKKSPGLAKSKIIVGRGNSSRKGNYCGRGLAGQKSRAGGSIPSWFEGGQTPLHMRLPKLRGFKRYFKLMKNITPVDVIALNNDDRVADGQDITVDVLLSLGYVKKSKIKYGVKILGTGKVTKKMNFSDVAFSKTAAAAIEKAGGSTGLTAE